MLARDPEVVLVHGAMQDIAKLGALDASSACEAASVELAKLIVRFETQLSADERDRLINTGGGLLQAQAEFVETAHG